MFNHEEINQQVARIERSSTFSKSEKLKALLRYLVEQTLSENADRLKGFSIAIDVFDRDPSSFEPTSDSIVRVQVGRLRAGLDTYYNSDGLNDPIRLKIPKGGYKVVFSAHDVDSIKMPAPEPGDAAGEARAVEVNETSEDSDPKPVSTSAPNFDDRWPELLGRPILLGLVVLAVLSFLILLLSPRDSRTPGHHHSATAHAHPDHDGVILTILPFLDVGQDGVQRGEVESISLDLATALGRSQVLRFVTADLATSLEEGGPERHIDYRLEGVVRRADVAANVTVRLIEVNTGETIWSHTYESENGSSFETFNELIKKISLDLRPQIYRAAYRQIQMRGPQTAWEYYFLSTLILGVEKRNLDLELTRIGYARRALELAPDHGQAHSVLAEKLAFLANVDPQSNTEENLSDASYHALEAGKHTRNNSDVLLNLALYNWQIGEHGRTQTLLQRVMELDPSNALAEFLLLHSSHVCVAAPDAKMAELRDYLELVSLDNPGRVVMLYQLARLHILRGEYEEALEYHEYLALITSMPYIVFQHAAVLVQLDKPDEAVAIFEANRLNWPTSTAEHFGSVAQARLCNERPGKPLLQQIYRDLDTVVKQANGLQ